MVDKRTPHLYAGFFCSYLQKCLIFPIKCLIFPNNPSLAAGIFVEKGIIFFSGNQPFLWKPSINLNLFFMCRYFPRLTSFSSILRTFLFLITNFLKKGNNALAAAIEMQQAVREVNRQRGTFPVRISIGMHTGLFTMGITGDENRPDACTISDTVNTASRLESLTRHFKADVLISENCLSRSMIKGNFIRTNNSSSK